MSTEVLHVVQRLSSGGAGQALRALIAGTSSARHRVVSLVAAEPSAAQRLTASEVALVESASEPELDALVASSDVVQVHFWNTPELYDFMATPRHARVVVWSHVAGHTPPHIVTPDVASYADVLVATGDPFPAAIARRTSVIRPSSPHRIPPARPGDRGSRPFTVGLFGTLDEARCDPDAVRMFAQAALPGSRLLVVGAGDLIPRWREQAHTLGLADRVEFTGFVADVATQLHRMDVLLHLPRPDGSATADLALQEAMTAGVVPVVGSGTPVTGLVRHEVDGLVVTDASDCIAALRALHDRAAWRSRLSAAAAARGSADFTPQTCGRQFDAMYADMCEHPRELRGLPGYRSLTGAQRFLASLGPAGEPFQISARRGPGADAADDLIARSGPAMVGAGAGGILHYRGYYPHDPMLRYWAGLVFAAAGRTALAAGDFAFAASRGVAAANDRLTASVGSVGASSGAR